MFTELERRRAEIARHAENSARLAQAYSRVSTTGAGVIEIPDRIDFEVTFIEEPYVCYGSQVDAERWKGILEDGMKINPIEPALAAALKAVDVPLPQCTGYVTHWDQDEHEYYTGAWVALAVTWPLSTGQPDYSLWTEFVLALNQLSIQIPITHHFTFAAIAMKAIPLDVRN